MLSAALPRSALGAGACSLTVTRLRRLTQQASASMKAAVQRKPSPAKCWGLKPAGKPTAQPAVEPGGPAKSKAEAEAAAEGEAGAAEWEDGGRIVAVLARCSAGTVGGGAWDPPGAGGEAKGAGVATAAAAAHSQDLQLPVVQLAPLRLRPEQPPPQARAQEGGAGGSQPASPLSPFGHMRSSEAELVPLQTGGKRSSFLSGSPGSLRAAAAAAMAATQQQLLGAAGAGGASAAGLGPGEVYWIPPLPPPQQQPQQPQQEAAGQSPQLRRARLQHRHASSMEGLLLPPAAAGECELARPHQRPPSSPLAGQQQAAQPGGSMVAEPGGPALLAAGAGPAWREPSAAAAGKAGDPLPLPAATPPPAPGVTADVQLASPGILQPQEFTAVVQRRQGVTRWVGGWARLVWEERSTGRLVAPGPRQGKPRWPAKPSPAPPLLCCPTSVS